LRPHGAACLCCLSVSLPPPLATLVPYTTLFRSLHELRARDAQELLLRVLELCANDFLRAVDWNAAGPRGAAFGPRRVASRELRRSEEHTSELQSRENLVCSLLPEKHTHTIQSSC